ncbi:MAG TPA: DUF2244 domain-containing protein [Hyphomicrobiaceae bacterium]|nr:DUF2244 domain-containing protein [Hyphomicrobiaceae bacterium]
MDEKTARTQAEPDVFRAVLMPYRSLGPKGFLLLMTGLAVVSFASGVAFVLMGAWPVAGFFGLDALLLYAAFRLNYRAGRMYETVEVTPDALTVTRVRPSGRSERFSCNPYWARVSLRQRPNGRTDLDLISRGGRLAIGRFLTDDERRDFADALKAALTSARGGARI